MKNLSVTAFAFIMLALTAVANAGSLGPSPYLSFNCSVPPSGCTTQDSPFKSLTFSFFHLETFEDHLLNVPGVTASAGGVTSVVFGPSIHDSVDADDGTIDGSGLLGDSFFSADGSSGISFTFNAGVLGSLPTHAGVVWTDGAPGGATSFSAFGPGNVLLGTIGPVSIADGSNNGETGEDRFFGWTDPGGILSIHISSPGGGIEVDHLQYGRAVTSVNPVPEPSTIMLLGSGLAGLIAFRYRCRNQA